jgi:hypothetical protein
VDALVPNSPGVPEPHQSLDEHVANFARQGFTSEEMIGLIACMLRTMLLNVTHLILFIGGHSFGGVERQFFPEIVPSPSNETDENFDATFDTAPFGFDNRMCVISVSCLFLCFNLQCQSDGVYSGYNEEPASGRSQQDYQLRPSYL